MAPAKARSWSPVHARVRSRPAHEGPSSPRVRLKPNDEVRFAVLILWLLGGEPTLPLWVATRPGADLGRPATWWGATLISRSFRGTFCLGQRLTMQHALKAQRAAAASAGIVRRLAVADRGSCRSARLCLLVCVSGDNAVAGLNEFETVNARMAWHESQFSNELESRLREGLSALRPVASEIGAHSVSAFLVRDGRTIRNLYMWPKSRMERSEVQLERAMGDVLRNFAGYASESSPIARFLKRSFQPEGTSFLLLSWGTDRLNAAIAFGFVSSSVPEGLAKSEMPRTASLASVAAWSVYEVFRLHSELVVVNDRLGTRKLVERAKGMLQAEHGLDEQQAYAHLRRLSRQRRMRMSEIATDLLATSRLS
jgi:hypothetical protein